MIAEANRNRSREQQQPQTSQSPIASNFSNQNLFNDEKQIYMHEKLLLEQDAHLLEEKRYLNRLKNSEIRQNKFLNDHYANITKPMIEKQRMLNEMENQQVEQRLNAYNSY